MEIQLVISLFSLSFSDPLSFSVLNLSSIFSLFHELKNSYRVVVRLWQLFFITFSFVLFVGCSVRVSCCIYFFVLSSVKWLKCGGHSCSLVMVNRKIYM